MAIERAAVHGQIGRLYICGVSFMELGGKCIKRGEMDNDKKVGKHCPDWLRGELPRVFVVTCGSVP